MESAKLKLSQIHPYEQNAKKHSKKQVAQIAKSIKEFGFNQPIVVDKDNEIIVGHGRFHAAKLLGLEDVPIIKLKNLTEEQVQAYRLADNKLNESPWDMNLVIENLKYLDSQKYDVTLTGFDIALIQESKDDGFDTQAEYNKIKTPTTKLGDLFELGTHRLLCGDSTKRADFELLMGGGLADMVFTDPPYSVDYESSGGNSYSKGKHAGKKIFNDNKNPEDAKKFYIEILNNLAEFTVDKAPIYWWYAARLTVINMQAFEEAGWHYAIPIIWLKEQLILSRTDYHRIYEPALFGWKKGKSHFTNKAMTNFTDVINKDEWDLLLDVWKVKRDNTADYVHPTQKPVKLSERALKKSSMPGDIVLEAFGGSGSTLIGCEQLKRRCFALELDPKYCDVIIKRWENYSGQKAKQINNQNGAGSRKKARG